MLSLRTTHSDYKEAVILDRLRFLYNRISEKLWVKPLIICLFSIAIAFIAKVFDHTGLGDVVPEINQGSIEGLLNILSSSMLVIATFSVASMVSAYASASNTATPRTFSLVIADDVSQNALSTFIGAFIFSIVSLTITKNDYFDKAGLFVLFSITALVFALVVLTFVRWVDRIARLGRLGETIDKVEEATRHALINRRRKPRLGGTPIKSSIQNAMPIYSDKVGYIQRIDVDILHSIAKHSETRISVAALPGKFVAPGTPLAYLIHNTEEDEEVDISKLTKAFVIGADRKFDQDPRFGLIVLSEIACRALSPAVNDPGTAIDIIGTFVRLFSLWAGELEEIEEEEAKYDRVEIPEITLDDMFDDAFTGIGRDGAGSIEVVLRLQKALLALSSLGEKDMHAAAKQHSRISRERAKIEMSLSDDIDRVEKVSETLIASGSS